MWLLGVNQWVVFTRITAQTLLKGISQEKNNPKTTKTNPKTTKKTKPLSPVKTPKSLGHVLLAVLEHGSVCVAQVFVEPELFVLSKEKKTNTPEPIQQPRWWWYVLLYLPRGVAKHFSIAMLIAQTVQPWVWESIPQKAGLKSSDVDNLLIALIYKHDALFLDV